MPSQIMRPKNVRIYSENDDIQHVETLRRKREKRHKSREFLVEGAPVKKCNER